MDLVDRQQQLRVPLAQRDRLVLHARAAHAQELTLANDRQVVVAVDPGLALLGGQRLSALDKKSRSTVNSPINVESGLMLSVRMEACAPAE